MKPDEKIFLAAVASRRPRQRVGEPMADEIGADLGMNRKRVAYLLDKWINKDWWDCGVSNRTGWLTEKGLAAASELSGETI